MDGADTLKLDRGSHQTEHAHQLAQEPIRGLHGRFAAQEQVLPGKPAAVAGSTAPPVPPEPLASPGAGRLTGIGGVARAARDQTHPVHSKIVTVDSGGEFNYHQPAELTGTDWDRQWRIAHAERRERYFPKGVPAGGSISLTDPALPDKFRKHSPWQRYRYLPSAMPLGNESISPDGTRQGSKLADCALVAAWLAAAAADPHILRDRMAADGTRVKLAVHDILPVDPAIMDDGPVPTLRDFRSAPVSVMARPLGTMTQYETDNTLPRKRFGRREMTVGAFSDTSAWLPLAEKIAAGADQVWGEAEWSYHAGFRNSPTNVQGYGRLALGYTGCEATNALAEITGYPALTVVVDRDETGLVLTTLESQQRNENATIVGFLPSSAEDALLLKNLGLTDEHEYAVTEATADYLLLRDPHGTEFHLDKADVGRLTGDQYQPGPLKSFITTLRPDHETTRWR